MTKRKRRTRNQPTSVDPVPEDAVADGQSTATTITIGPAHVVSTLVIVALVALAALIATGALQTPSVPSMLSVPSVDHTSSLWLVFLTGLTVGGLSCLAVQGGLLTAMIAQRDTHAGASNASAWERSVPVIQFLFAKTLAYAAVGAALGFFGSKIPLSLQGWLMIFAGVFMVVVVLQMFDVHPFFRRFAFKPPKTVQRMVRRQSKHDGRFTPFVLGAMTIFIPCGVTIAMEALAIASESPIRGALIMTAFTLGTAPIFLVLGLAATQLSQSANRLFRPAAAVMITVVAGLSIISGARLLGFGTSFVSGETQAATIVEQPAAPAEAAAGADAGAVAASTAYQEATVNVTTGAYNPAVVQVKAGMPTRLHLNTRDTQGCIRAFVVPSLGIERILPDTGTETVEIPASEPGRIAFMCSMGMYNGVIEVVN